VQVTRGVVFGLLFPHMPLFRAFSWLMRVYQRSGMQTLARRSGILKLLKLDEQEMLLPKMGRVWFYEGETLGYRMTYIYLPKKNVVWAVGLNSQPNKKEDHVGQLMTAVYNRLHAAGNV